jgi:uncharacterized membrane protein YfcA
MTLESLALFAAAGLAGALVQSRLRMGFGFVAAAVLLAGGAGPLLATAAIHAGKLAGSGATALRVDTRRAAQRGLLLPLLASGVIGAVVALLLAAQASPAVLRTLVAFTLVAVGLALIATALARRALAFTDGGPAWLGLIGGALDALTGGGWRPVVVGSLTAQGHARRAVEASATTAETVVAGAVLITLGVVAPHQVLATEVLALVAGLGAGTLLGRLSFAALPPAPSLPTWTSASVGVALIVVSIAAIA